MSSPLKGLIYKKDRARMAWVDAKEGTAALDYRELEIWADTP